MKSVFTAIFRKDPAYIRWIKKHKKKSIALAIIFVLMVARMALSPNEQATVDAPAMEQAVQVELLDIAQSSAELGAIQSTGEVEALEQVELRSEVVGKVTRVLVGLGDRVQPGQLLVQLDAANLAAQRDQAQAAFDQALAAKVQLEAQYEAQQANHAKVLVGTNNAVQSAEAALALAENNLRLSEDVGNSQIVLDTYENVFATLQNAQATFGSALVTADSIVGVDDVFVNDAYENELGILNESTRNAARFSYYSARDAITKFEREFGGLTKQDQKNIDTAIDTAIASTEVMQTLFRDVIAILDSTRALGDLSQTTLDGLRASVQGGQTAINAQYSTLLAQRQAIQTAKNSLDSTQVAYTKAQQDVAAVKAQATADIAASEAALKQSEASVHAQEASIAAARAQIANINASLGKTAIRTPIAGEVAVLPAKVGELVSGGALIASVVNTAGLQVTSYVPSDAVADIAVGNSVTIAEQYAGTVTHVSPSIDPQTKKVEVIIALADNSAPLVVGEFVDVSVTPIQQEETSVFIPLAAVQISATEKYVFVLGDNDLLVKVPVEVARLSGNSVEITAGLENQTMIVSSVRGLKEGEQVRVIK